MFDSIIESHQFIANHENLYLYHGYGMTFSLYFMVLSSILIRKYSKNTLTWNLHRIINFISCNIAIYFGGVAIYKGYFH